MYVGTCSVLSVLKKSSYVIISVKSIFHLQNEEKVKWASRWDYILVSMPHTNIQWFRYGVMIFFFFPPTFLLMLLTASVTFVSSVQHHELLSHRSLPVWDGGYDHAENLAQGHCPIQPGGPGKAYVRFSQVQKNNLYLVHLSKWPLCPTTMIKWLDFSLILH